MRIAQEVGAARVELTQALALGGLTPSPAAIDGIDTLREMVSAAAGRIEIMAGSGVNAASAPALAATGVDAVHFSVKRILTADSGVRMGSADDGAGGYEATDRDAAHAVREALGLPARRP